MSVATKKNPRLWERAKKMACSKGKLCKHSARKMQWATRYYKDHGGRYVGARSSRNSLTRWGKQKWRTSSGKKSRGRLRYLPDRAWKALTPSERRRTNTAKRRGYRRGKQYVRQPRDVARRTKRYRTSGRSSGRRRRSSGRRSSGRRRRSSGRRSSGRRRRSSGRGRRSSGRRRRSSGRRRRSSGRRRRSSGRRSSGQRRRSSGRRSRGRRSRR